MTTRCIGLGCDSAPVNALDLGQRWADGRVIHKTACAKHTLTCVAYQHSRGVTALVFPIGLVEIVGVCMACWRSHGCDLPDDHEGEHVCGSRDPDGPCDPPSGEVFHAITLKPCARTGGVPR